MRPGLRDRLHLLLSSHAAAGLAKRLSPRNMLRWRRHPSHPAASSAPDLPTTASSSQHPSSSPSSSSPPEPSSIPRVSSAPGQIHVPTVGAPQQAPPARQETTKTTTTTTTRQSTANGRSKAPTPPLKKLVRKAQSWSPKALPSTSIIRENIAGGTIKPKGSPEFSRFESPRDDDIQVASAGSVRRGSSLRPKAIGGMMDDKKTSRDEITKAAKEPPLKAPAEEATEQSQPVNESGDADRAPGTESAVEEAASQQQPAASSGWMSWWYRSSPTTIPPIPAAPIPTSGDPTPTDNTLEEASQEGAEQGQDEPAAAAEDEAPAPPSNRSEPEPVPVSSAGWYGYLPSMSMLPSVPVPGLLSYAYPLGKGRTDADKKQPPPEGTDASVESSAKEPSTAGSSTKGDSPTEPVSTDPQGSSSGQNTDDGEATISQVDSAKKGAVPKVGSTWAFWYRDSPSGTKGKAAEAESGEIAVMGEGSEAAPTPAAEGDVAAAPPAQDSNNNNNLNNNKSDTEAKEVKEAVQSGALSMWRRTKKARPVSLDIDSILPASLHVEGIKPLARASTAGDRASAAAAQIAEQVRVSTPASEASATTQLKPNLLLPSFASTYQMKENPSILRQITKLVVGSSSHPPPNHVFRTRSAPKIRKAIAIGVHGFFPATYLRPMIGQPTGTSLRFANLAAEAIRRWADDHGSPNCEIEKVALEGEGRINERVDNLWKLMLNWVQQIREADLIIMACHSQGVPVGVMLLQKLIDLGIVTHARIGVCAMAGVSLGPFPDLKSSIFTGSAAELWEFGIPQSNNSLRFELSLKRILDYGARITFIGSIDDQVVPMESAVYSPANHPYIYRAVFIDGRVHAPDFIAHLIGFALKLRNLGVSDHGLIRELSVPLAGSLYSGEGHSRLYYDAAVYDLAIAHALETSNTAGPTPCDIRRRESPTSSSTPNSNLTSGSGVSSLASANPFVLPWIMRGLLEEAYVKTELSAETEELLRQFDDWRPVNKALKDVKYRLEAVRSKL